MPNRALTALIFASACTGDLDDPSTEQIASAVVAPAPCETFPCGGNTPMVNGVYFWELYKPELPFAASTQENEQHVRILHYYASEADADAGKAADGTLDVVLGKFATASVGSILEVAMAGTTYWIRIADITDHQQYWTESPDYDPAQLVMLTYWFEYKRPHLCHLEVEGGIPVTTCDPYRPLCKDQIDAAGDPALPAIVFEGDRYKPGDLVVQNSDMVPTPADPGTWFNIACSGGLPAKMYLTRRTIAAALQPNTPIGVQPRAYRQAFARMWAADYCGDGHSFTVPGHELRIRDPQNSLRTDIPVGFTDGDYRSVEAVWDETGVRCIGEPRLRECYSADDVIEYCARQHPDRLPIPRCPATVESTWTADPAAVVLSVNPKPPERGSGAPPIKLPPTCRR